MRGYAATITITISDGDTITRRAAAPRDPSGGAHVALRSLLERCSRRRSVLERLQRRIDLVCALLSAVWGEVPLDNAE